MNLIGSTLTVLAFAAVATSIPSSSPPLIINLAPGDRIRLTEEHIRISPLMKKTAVSAAAQLWFEVKETRGGSAGIVDARGAPQQRFNVAQLMHGQVFLSQSSKVAGTSAELVLAPVALGDGERGDERWPVTRFKILSKPVELRMDTNSGIHLVHKSSQIFTRDNLSFSSNHPDLPVEYSIVDQPAHGVVECLQRGVLTSAQFQLCSRFSQSDIDAMRVRYRHISTGRPDEDSFSLQVHSGGVSSLLHHVSVRFIPVTVRVIMSDRLLLSNSDEAVIGREHMAASTFPRSFPPQQLVYHVVDPPKLGMLSRRLAPSAPGAPVRAKSRRIGVSSNFTQAHVDEGLLHYRLNFHHYSLKRDSFSFRLITPATVSELLHFEIGYIPDANAINLWNRTLVVQEGGSKHIANNTLWLETPDDKIFRFTIAHPPLYGRITLGNDDGGKFYLLEPGASFTSLDIAQRRLFYEHSGDESRADRMLLVAQSLYSDGGASVPFWFTIAIIADNDHAPQLLGGTALGRGSTDTLIPTNEVLLLRSSGVGVGGTAERTLHPSLLPWFDGDDHLVSNRSGITASPPPTNLLFHFPDIYRDFVIHHRDSPDNPVHNFTMTDLADGSLVIRQLSSKDESTARFTVSDGNRSTRANLLVRCSDSPELRLVAGRIAIPANDKISGGVNNRYILVTPRHLLATTNADMDMDEIRYEVRATPSVPFRLLLNGVMTAAVNGFSQRDIRANLLFVAIDEVQQRGLSTFSNLTLRAGGMSNPAALEYFRGHPEKATPQTAVLTLPRDGHVALENSSSVTIDSDVLGVELLFAVSDESKFVVLEPPRYGVLSLNAGSYNYRSLGGVERFRTSDLAARRLVYTYSGRVEQEDYLMLEAVVPVEGLPSHRIGPIRLTFKPIDVDQIYLSAAPNLSVKTGGYLQFDDETFRLHSTSENREAIDNLEYRVVKGPHIGSLVNNRPGRARPDTQLHTASSFSHNDLRAGQVVYQAPNRTSAGTTAVHFTLKACTTGAIHARCTAPTQVAIRVEPSSETEEGFNAPQLPTAIEAVAAQDPPQLEANLRLNAAPGIPTVVGMDTLRAHIPGVPAERTLFLLTALPLHGKLLFVEEAGAKAIDAFSQADINSRRLVYQSLSANLGVWTQRDSFDFVVVVGTAESLGTQSQNKDQMETLKGRKKMAVREFKFRISTSYSNIPSTQLDKFVPSAPVVVSQGGSVLLNSTHLNLTLLSQYCDDSVWLDIHAVPRSGLLKRVDMRHETLPTRNSTRKDATSSRTGVAESGMEEGSTSSGVQDEDYGDEPDTTTGMMFSAEEIHSGRALFYQNLGDGNRTGDEIDDEFVLAVWPSREQHRSNRLRIPLRIRVNRQLGQLGTAVVERFPERVQIVSGQSASLLATEFQASSPGVPPSQLTYKVIQAPSNGARVRVVDDGSASMVNATPSTSTPEFTQAQVNKGLVRLEHIPLPSPNDDGERSVDAMTVEIGRSETRVLLVQIEPLQLSLLNHSIIELQQGRTYVVLNSSHLGASSNGEVAKIHYNITRLPQNGSLYWVDGEREASSFFQSDINNGQLLYAQLNMASYMDSFDFVLSNEETELAKSTARIRILPAVRPVLLLTQARTITRVTLFHLNASLLEGVPRYVVVKAPSYGRLFLHPASNKSAHFFTHSDIQDGLLFFHAFDVQSRALDTVELELRSDHTAPARFVWPIDIRPFGMESGEDVGGALTDGSGRRLLAVDDDLFLPDGQFPPPNTLTGEEVTKAAGMPPELNYHFPIVILAVVVLSVLTLLLCRRSRSSKGGKKSSAHTLDENDFAHKISLGHPLPDLDDVLDAGSKSSGNNAADLLDATVYGGGSKGPRRDMAGGGGMSAITTAPFALPSSKRPAAVSTVVPTFATFDEVGASRADSSAVGVRFGTRHNGVSDHNTGVLRRPNRSTAVSSEARRTMQTAMLAAAAAARVAEKQRGEVNGNAISKGLSASGGPASRDAIARLKQNQYWV